MMELVQEHGKQCMPLSTNYSVTLLNEKFRLPKQIINLKVLIPYTT